MSSIAVSRDGARGIRRSTLRPVWIFDRIVTLLVWAAVLLFVAVFLGFLTELLGRGFGRLSWSFVVDAPARAGRAGGIAPIVVSTLAIVAIAITATIPLGLTAALWLVEVAPRGSRAVAVVATSVDALAGVPSVVFGLFGNALFCVALGLGFSILSGGLTLACMALPIFVRTAVTGLRAVPAEWRRGAAALGLSQLSTLRQVVIPAAAPALVAALLLAIGRSIAETAALLFTSGYVDRMPSSWFDSGRALSVHIHDLAMNVAGGESSAYASALVLVALLVGIDVAASHVAQGFVRKEARK